ncbi:hemagglutinin repeat-containing protein, partial [Chromobacterium violaceum]|nr:hemagglutinin repeat-containing protein [Chromobacterium violaceum]
ATGTIQSGKDLQLTAASLTNADKGQILALGKDAASKVDVSGELHNQGKVAGNADLTVNAASIDNSKGTLQAASHLELSKQSSLINDGGHIAGQSLKLNADSLSNQAGEIYAQQQLSSTLKTLNNAQGSLIGGQGVDLTVTDSLHNDGVVGSDGQVKLTAGKLDNATGTIQSGKDLQLSAASLTNAEKGQILALGKDAASTVDVSGELHNQGKLAGNADLTVNAASIDNSKGTLQAANHLELSKQSTLTNDGGHIAGQSLKLNADSLSNKAGEIYAQDQLISQLKMLDNSQGSLVGSQGVDLMVTGTLHNDGTLGSDGQVKLSAGELDNATGTIQSGKDLQLTSQSLTNADKGQILALGKDTASTLTVSNDLHNQGKIAGNGQLDVNAATVNNSHGTLQAAGALNLIKQSSLINDGGHLAAQSLNLKADSLSNQAGSIYAQSQLTALLGTLDNTKGSLAGAQGLNLGVQGRLHNDGSLGSDGQVILTAGALDNGAGTIVAGKDLQLTASTLANADKGQILAQGQDAASAVRVDGQLSNQGKILAASDLNVQAGALDNSQGTLQSVKALTVTAQNTLANTSGHIAGQSLSVSADALNNQAGELYSQQGLDGRFRQLGNSQGSVVGGQHLALNVKEGLSNGGVLGSGGQVQLTVGQQLDNGNGTIQAGQDLQVTTDALSNAGQIAALGQAGSQLTVARGLGNQGKIIGNGQLDINASTVDNSKGTLQAAGALNLTKQASLSNDGGHLAAQSLNIKTDTLSNQGGDIRQTGTGAAQLQVGQDFNNQHGQVLSNGALTVSANRLDNSQGTLAGQGALQTQLRQDLNNQGGALLSAQALNLSLPGAINNQQGQIQGNSLQVNGASLDNRGGTVKAIGNGDNQLHLAGKLDNSAGGAVLSNGNLDLKADQLDNRQGSLQASGLLNARVGQDLSNQGGQLLAGQLQLDANNLWNQGGKLGQAGMGQTLLTLRGQLDNSAQGKITSNGQLTLSSGDINNYQGMLSSQGDLVLHGSNLINRQGTLGSQAALTISTGQIDNDGGLVQAGRVLQLDAASLNNGGGRVLALGDGDSQLTIQGQLSSGGAIAGNGKLQLSTQHFDNSGSVYSQRSLGIRTTTLGSIGTLLAGHDLNLGLQGDFINNGGLQLQAGRNLSISASGNLVNNGQLQSGGSLSLSGLNWTNNGSVSIGGTFSTHLSQNLYNYGTLGADALDLNAANVTNAGSITARDITIQAVNLDNGGSKALLASAGNMALNIGGALNNHDGAWIYSLGDMRIGQAGAQVGQVINHVATLQSDSNMSIWAGGVSNEANPVAITQKIERKGISSHPIGDGCLYGRNKWGECNGGETAAPDGYYSVYDLITTDIADEVVSPARFLVSGNLFLNIASNSVANKNSQISVGGSLLGLSKGDIQNYGQPLHKKVVEYNETSYFDPNQKSQNKISSRLISDEIYSNSDAVISVGQALHLQAPHIENGGVSSFSSSPVTGIQQPGAGVISQAQGQSVAAAWDVKPPTSVSLSGSVNGMQASSVVQSGSVDAGNGLVLPNHSSAQTNTGQLLNGGVVDVVSGKSISTDGVKQSQGDAMQGALAATTGNSLVRQAGQDVSGKSLNGSLDEARGGGLSRSIAQFNGDILRSSVTNELSGSHLQGQLIETQAARLDGAVNANPGKTLKGTVENVSAHTMGARDTAGLVGQKLSGEVEQTQAGNLGKPYQPVPAVRQMIMQSGGAKAGNPVAVGYVVPDNGLFHIQNAPQQPYLVETNPQFTQYGKFVSSDYLLKQLGYNPSQVEKRLGDGFYEQQLVSKAITDMTGKRFLSGYGSAMQQYQQLMTNGAQYAKQFQLNPGLALSAEQMKQLTSDMVWLVKQNVGGQDVLVPVVYLSNADQQSLLGKGAVLAGSNMNLQADGQLVNRGVIEASDSLFAKAGSIKIDGGVVQSSGDLGLQSTEDIQISTKYLQTGASVIGQNVDIDANRDVLLDKASITIHGSGQVTAGRDILLNSHTSDLQEQNGGYGSWRWGQTTVGSSVQADGDLLLKAGRDITLSASTATAGGVLQANAGRDVNLISVLNDQYNMSVKNLVNADWLSTQTVAAASLHGGSAVGVSAGNDLSLKAAQITSDGLLQAQAGHDINVDALISKQSSSALRFDHIESNSGNTVNGSLISGKSDTRLMAEHDLRLTASQMQSQQGLLSMKAGNDILLNSAASSNNGSIDTFNENVHTWSDTTQHGSEVQGQKGVVLQAGRDISTQASSITSNAQSLLIAGRDVNLGSAQERHSDYSKTVSHSGGWFSSSTTTDIVAHDSTHEAGSTVSADTVILKGQRDINIHASQVAGSGDVTLDAGRNLNITSGTDTSRLFQYHKEETSGLFSGGGLGFTIGSKELMQQMDGAGTTQSQNRSLVGSIGGNLNIKTGDTLTLQGSDVTAGGNLYLDTRKQNLDVAVDTWHSVQKTESKSSGLTVQLTSPFISGVQAMASAADTALKSKDDRVKALSTATAALAGYNSYTAYQQALAGQNTKEGNGIKLSISIGGSRSESTTVSDSHNESGSLLKSGGTLVDLAHGAGQGSIVTGKGAQFVAGKDLTLQAEGDIHLLAAKSTSSEHTTSSSSSAAVGVAIGYGSEGFTYGLSGSASYGRGKVDGNGSQYQLSELNAGGKLNLVSGGNVTLQGIAKGQQVVGDIAGNLKIDSLQDTSTYHSLNQSISAQGSMSGGSATLSQQKMDADYASVQRQSGIQAGDGGFQLTVKGTTALNGAEIASTDKAAQDGKNSLQTGALVLKDIDNHADFTASSISVTAGSSGVTGMAMAASDHDNSTTRAGISAGSLTITDNALQQAKTGQTAEQAAASANRDVSTGRDGSGKLANNFNASEVQGLFDAANALNQQVGTFMANKAAEAKAAADALKDADPNSPDYASKKQAADDSAKWAPGGSYSQILTAVTAGIGGNLANGLTGMAQNAGIAYLQGLGAQEAKALADDLERAQSNDPDHADKKPEGEVVRAVLHAALACAGAEASGQSCGAGAAGGAASVALNNALDKLQHTDADKMTAEEKLQRENLVNGLLTGLSTATGGAETAATTVNAAKTEMENNFLTARQITDKEKALASAKGRAAKDKIEAAYAVLDKEQQKGAEKKISDNTLGVMTIVEYQQDRDDLQKLLASSACIGECRSDAISSLKKVGDILNWYKIQNHDKPLFEALDNINTASVIADAPAAVGGIIKLGIKGLTKVGVLEDIAVDVGKVATATEKSDVALGSCMVPGSCFVAGTRVLTDKGLKAIETFVGGELVWSRSDQTGEYGFQPVVAHKATQDQAIYRVVVEDEIGRQETFRTTAEHPFWLKDQGWLKASLLQTGMILVDHAGQPLTVVSQVEEDETEIVFNIQVAQFQTYHVGELGVWVHNADCCRVTINVDNKGNALIGDWSATKSLSAPENAGIHWGKHSSEFPEIENASQYVEIAQGFVSNPPAGVLKKVRPNGDVLLYDPATNTFAVKNSSGAPRTMFRPGDGINYWKRQ